MSGSENRRDLVVIGASAGGVEALRELVAGLDPDLPATVLVVLHLAATTPSALARILDRAGPLPARNPEDGAVLRHGEVLVAVPDRHLLVDDGAVVLSAGPRENGHRPAVDPLFRTAARVRGPRVVAVVLSGALDDGSAGLVAVKGRGGLAVVQAPADALHPSMPAHAIDAVPVDHVATAAELGPLLSRLVREPAPPWAPEPSRGLVHETDVAAFDTDAIETRTHPGTPSSFSCPDCSRTLWQVQEGEPVRLRRRVGHAWSADSLLAQQGVQLEAALWSALRALEEKAAPADRLSARRRDHLLVAERFSRQATEARERAAAHDLLARGTGDVEPTEAAG